MSPTRRDVIKASAGLVAAALAGVSPVVAHEETIVPDKPQVIGVTAIAVGLKMSDGTCRYLNVCQSSFEDDEAIGQFSVRQPDGTMKHEWMSAKDAEWTTWHLMNDARAIINTLAAEGVLSV